MSADLDRLADVVVGELLARGGRERGDEIVFRCLNPDHPDEHPSARYHRSKASYICDPCGWSGGLVRGDHPLAPLLGFDLENGAQQRQRRRPRAEGRPSQSWEIRDADGRVVALHHRRDEPEGEKRVWWAMPDGTLGLAGMKSSDLPLYGADRLGDREPGDDTPVIVCEGERAADALLELGLSVVGTVTGASSAPGAEALEVLRGRDVVLWPDADDAGQRHMTRVAELLRGVAASTRIFVPEGLPAGGDAVEWTAGRDGDVAGELLGTIEAEAVSDKPEPPQFEAVDEGRYRLAVPAVAVTLEADYLRREGGQLKCELMVRCELPGARTYDGVLSVGDLNLSSTRTRTTHAKYLAQRARTDDVDWTGLLEEFAQRVLAAERAGAPAIDLRAVARPVPDRIIDLEGVTLFADAPVVVFGDGGSLKSYIALYIAGTLAKRGHRVAFFDWEWASNEHRERLELLFGADMPPIYYARCTRPLVYEVERLRRIIRENNVDYTVFDSISFATDRPAETHEAANNYFQALRQLGEVGSLHTAHQKKTEDASQLYKPFGSVFWHNGARGTWYVQLADGMPGDPQLTVGLYNRKANRGARRPPVGLEFSFSSHRTRVRRVDLADVEELAAKLPAAERVCMLLRRGSLDRDEIKEALPDVKPGTLKVALHRLEQSDRVVRFPSAAGGDRFGLAEGGQS